jgi:hypothetical protein
MRDENEDDSNQQQPGVAALECVAGQAFANNTVGS